MGRSRKRRHGRAKRTKFYNNRTSPRQRNISNNNSSSGERGRTPSTAKIQRIKRKTSKHASKELKDHILFQLENGVPMKYASMGFSKQTIYKWIQEKDSPSEKVKPGPEKTLNHEQLLKLRKDMLDKKYPNQMIAAEAYGVKQKTVSRCLTEYSKDAGLLPIRRKRGASRRTDSNQPRIYDTGLGFINTFDAITPESKAFRNIQDGPASIYTIRTRSRRVNNGQALV